MPKKMHGDEEIRTNDLVRVIKNEKSSKGDQLKDIEPTPQNYKKFKGDRSGSPGLLAGLPRGIVWGVLGLVLLFVIGFIASYFFVKARVASSLSSQVVTLQAGVTDLQNLHPESAQQKFLALATTSAPTFGGIMDFFGFLFKGGSTALSSFDDLTNQLSTLSGDVITLQPNIVTFISTGQGSGLVSALSNLRDTLGAVDADANQLSGTLSSLQVSASTSTTGISGTGGGIAYLPLKAQIESTQDFLNSFIPWLSDPASHHVLVLLENSSEMRPGGGFLGSYADVALAGGNITSVSVNDIADVDEAFTPKIVPPVPLQLETKNFRPADANWFFDFPTSASKTLQFFASSSLYTPSTTFDGVLAVSPKVINDLLSITGPITIMSTWTNGKIASTTFSSDNFLVQVQDIIQLGQGNAKSKTSATGAGLVQSTYPKAILGVLMQAIFTQLAASSTDAQKQQLAGMAVNWITDRDIMAYFTNPTLENFLIGYGAAGDVDPLPQNFNGDYLAIADADINSDKSELFVSQNVSLDCEINADGTISDSLQITRTHTGNTSPHPWYQTTNQDYMQVFVPDGSLLTNEVGGMVKNIPEPINYAKNNYSTDPTVAAIESSTLPIFGYPAVTQHEEDGREVFATWSRVAAGASTTVEFDYTHRAFVPPAAGVQYQFVFEKQAGTNRSYDFEIDAPLGYAFAENGLATYEYTSSDPPGRLVINLTLEKI